MEEKKMGIHVIEGKVVGQEMKVGIVAARFNEFIVSKLLSGAVDGLVRHGVEEDAITAVWVPGAFEIPLMAEKMAQSGKYDAVICVGAVIRGSTSHYDYVCSEVSKGIASVSLKTGVPVLFGVVTTENIEQAIERAGTKAGNKGYDLSLIHIFHLLLKFNFCEYVSHLVLLRFQIKFIIFLRLDLNRHPFADRKAKPIQTVNFARIIGQQPEGFHSHITQDLCSYPVLSQICSKTEFNICLHGIPALFLELVRLQFVDQPDPPAFLTHVQKNSPALCLNPLHGSIQLLSAVAPCRSKHITSQALGMYPA